MHNLKIYIHNLYNQILPGIFRHGVEFGVTNFQTFNFGALNHFLTLGYIAEFCLRILIMSKTPRETLEYIVKLACRGAESCGLFYNFVEYMAGIQTDEPTDTVVNKTATKVADAMHNVVHKNLQGISQLGQMFQSCECIMKQEGIHMRMCMILINMWSKFAHVCHEHIDHEEVDREAIMEQFKDIGYVYASALEKHAKKLDL